jgi:hypothetical protein
MGCFALMMAPLWLGLLVFEASLLHSLSLELYSATYPSVMGTIIAQGEGSPQYAYEVDGRAFQGYLYQYSANSPDDVAAWSGPEFRVGSPVRVFYRYGSPWESVLVKGVQGRTLVMLLGSTPPSLAVLWGFFLLVRSMRKSGLAVWAFEREGHTHVRLTNRTPLRMGLAGAGAVSLVLWFVVGFSMGFNSPPLTAAVLAWAFVVAAGVLTAWWWQAKLDTGLHDLILDEQARTLSLPVTAGRSTRRDLQWSDIQSVILDKQTRRGRKGSIFESFRCMILLRGASRAELVHDWQDDQDRAANLVNWLQARLGLDESTLVAPPAPAPVEKKKKKKVR